VGEHCYYNQGDIRITPTRAVFGHKTIALTAITSVAGVEVRPNRYRLLVLVTLGFVPFVFALTAGLETKYSIMLFSLALMAVSGAICWWMMRKPLYGVELCTSAGEFQAYVSRNEAEIDRIIEAIEQAIVDRG